MSEPSRRKFLSKIVLGLSGLAFLGEPLISLWARAWGEIKPPGPARGVAPPDKKRGSLSSEPYFSTKRKVVPRGTDRKSLINERPQDLDTRNLEITPVKEFGVMGLSDHPVNLDQWVLKVKGLVNDPLGLSYSQVRDLPFIERKVLLICQGFFANQGLWKGISIRTLLEKAGAKPGANFITVSGPEGDYTKPERFPLKEILSDQVFLAYQVNGEDLPQPNGFPLRLVAEDYPGYTWIKFVDTIEVDKI